MSNRESNDSHRLTLSVIIPTHNREDTVVKAVASVLEQLNPDDELIVVDDASTDGTATSLSSLTDNRVRTVINCRNLGPGGSRNVGAHVAKSTLLAFLDSDDKFAPDRVKEQRSEVARHVAARNANTVVFGRRVNVQSQEVALQVIEKGCTIVEQPSDSLSELLTDPDFYQHWPTMMVMRDRFLEVEGFDPRLPASEWTDLCIRLAVGNRFVFLRSAMELHTIGRSDRTWNLYNRSRASAVLIRKYRSNPPYPQFLARHRRVIAAYAIRKRGRLGSIPEIGMYLFAALTGKLRQWRGA